MKRLTTLLLASSLLSGCVSKMEELSQIADGGPALTHIQDPTTLPNYRPVEMPMPVEPIAETNNANSLWQPGARSFFKDQRASRLGDLITVKVSITEEAVNMVRKNDNKRIASTTGSAFNQAFEHAFLSKAKLLGLRGKTDDTAVIAPAADTDSKPTLTYEGKVENTFSSNMTIPCTIIQILGNGNMVLQGRQEFRAENEVRIMEVKGIIRREDIALDNTITSDKIAEARISYGGRGNMSNDMKAPYGQQIIKALAPY